MQIVNRSTLVFSTVIAVLVGGLVAVIGWMAAGAVGLLAGLVPVLIVAWASGRKPLRRWRAAKRGLPEASHRWLREHIPFYAGLEGEPKRRFEHDVLFFLEEERFEGVQGVEVTRERKLAVAAGAALMLHGRPGWAWPGGRSILFYPGAFDDNYYDSPDAELDGMVHHQGPILLAAPSVDEAWEDPHDGSNVVLHELAHCFDFLDAESGGRPAFLDAASAPAWQRIVEQEMARAQNPREMGLLRPYAATNEAELFAVAVENFFERPHALATRHTELFDALAALFGVDPRPTEEARPAEAAPLRHRRRRAGR